MTTGKDEPGVIASPETGRIAGAVLLIAAILTIVAMAHHPSGLDSDGAGPSLALYSGTITLNVDGAFVAYGVQAVWTGLVGLQMLRRHF